MTGEKVDVVSHETGSHETQTPLRSTAATQAPAEMPGVEEIARAIYNANLSSLNDDPLSVLIHCSEFVRDDVPLAEQLEHVMQACRDIAKPVAALFATILAEKEREIATFDSREAEWNEAIANSLQNEEDAHRKLEDAEAALAAERERCAKIAEDLDGEGPTGSYDNGGTIDGWNMATRRIAAAIRAQGE